MSVSSGVVKTLWLDHFIIVGCLDGLIRLVDSRNGEIVSVCVGNQGEILDLAICRTNSTVISGGGDNTCRVYYV